MTSVSWAVTVHGFSAKNDGVTSEYCGKDSQQLLPPTDPTVFVRLHPKLESSLAGFMNEFDTEQGDAISVSVDLQFTDAGGARGRASRPAG